MNNMRNFFQLSLVMLVVSIGFSENILAQTTEKQGRKAIRNLKPIKEARKEARKWKRQGFNNLPGSLPLENQIEKAMIMTVLKNKDGGPKYLSATGSARAGSEGVAQANALDNTRAELAGIVQSSISALVSSNKGSTQLSASEAETIDEFLSSSKTLIRSELGALKPTIIMFRQVGTLFEYRYTILYEMEEARIATKRVAKRELQEKIQDNEKKLDKILGLN